MALHVVIGTGPDGLRAAAARAARGEQVLLLQQGVGAAGLARPELPEADGSLRIGEATDRGAVVRALGPLVDCPAPRLRLCRGGQSWSLPLRPDAVPKLLPPGSRRIAARAWLRARARNAMAELVGGGQEERTHRDWVVRRMGVPAFDHLYADYAARRWGAPSESLGVGLARRHHSLPDTAPRVRPEGSAEEGLRRLVSRIREHGEIRSGVTIAGFHVEGGRVRGVRLAGGERIEADGVWVEDTPARAVSWLGASATAGLRVDAGRLPTRDRVRVGLAGVALGDGEVAHLLDPGTTAWRVVGIGGGQAIADCTLPAGAGAPPELRDRVAADVRAAGLGEAAPDGGALELERDAVALWGVTTPAVLREVLGPLGGFGVVMVGARGAVAGLGPGEALGLALHCAAHDPPDQREAQRVFIQGPTRVEDLTARITRFVTR